MAKKTDDIKVFCYTRGVRMPISPRRWLGILEKVLASPEEVIKEDSMKRTAKVGLSPWGVVCVSQMEWPMKKMLLSPLLLFRRQMYWNNLVSLLEKDIPIVEPVLYMEVKEGKFVIRSYLVTKWVECNNLGRLSIDRTQSTEKELTRLVKKATFVISHFHNLGFVHGNLHWTDILVDFSRREPIVVCGLEGVKRSSSYSMHGKDLARFVLSAYAYGFEREFVDQIVSWYFWAAGYRPESFDRGLIRQLAKYELEYKSLGSSRFDRLNLD